MAKKPYVDKSECTGCGQCIDDLPEVFQMGDDGLAEVHDPNGADEDDIQEEMDACTGECISWKEK